MKIGKDLEVGSIGPTLARSDLGKADTSFRSLLCQVRFKQFSL